MAVLSVTTFDTSECLTLPSMSLQLSFDISNSKAFGGSTAWGFVEGNHVSSQKDEILCNLFVTTVAALIAVANRD